MLVAIHDLDEGTTCHSYTDGHWSKGLGKTHLPSCKAPVVRSSAFSCPLLRTEIKEPVAWPFSVIALDPNPPAKWTHACQQDQA
jgi:hypothetical protein